MLSRCFFDFSVSVGAFVIGLSQTSSFFSSHVIINANAKVFSKVGLASK